jgi:Sulfotransferase domain
MILKKIFRDGVEYFRWIEHKKTLPSNPKHDDIYLVEFPKSGVTWLSHLLGSTENLLVSSNVKVTIFNNHKYIPDIHQLRGSKIRRFLDRTFIKSHSEFNPYYFFIVYLIRNPVDVMISFYNFKLDHGYKQSFDVFLQDKRCGVSAWKRHVNSWHYKSVGEQKMHFIRYEDLVENPSQEIQKIYDNLGVEITDLMLSEAVSLSSIDVMKASEEHYRKHNPNYTVNFVGREGKKVSKAGCSQAALDYILTELRDEIECFYPELIIPIKTA